MHTPAQTPGSEMRPCPSTSWGILQPPWTGSQPPCPPPLGLSTLPWPVLLPRLCARGSRLWGRAHALLRAELETC